MGAGVTGHIQLYQGDGLRSRWGDSLFFHGRKIYTDAPVQWQQGWIADDAKVGSGLQGDGIILTTGAGDTNGNGGNGTITLGTGAGTGAPGSLTIATTFRGAQVPITPYVTTASLTFSGLTADVNSTAAEGYKAFGAVTETDTSAFNYVYKYGAGFGRLNVGTSGASTIDHAETWSNVCTIHTTASGTLTTGYGVSGELLANGNTGAYNVTDFSGVFGTVQVGGNVVAGTLQGVHSFIDASTSGGVTQASGYDFVFQSSGGTTATVYGLHVAHPTLSSTGTATVIYGILIENQYNTASNTSISPFDTYGIRVDGGIQGGNTSGTSHNYTAYLKLGTSAAGSGGALQNTGLRITGNGNSGAGTTNFAIFSDSTGTAMFSGGVTIGTGGAALTGSKLEVRPSVTLVSTSALKWDGVLISAATATLSGSSNVTQAAGLNLITVIAPTISNASLTVTNAASLAITGAPIASGGMAITNAYSFWVQAGLSQFTTIASTGLLTNYNSVATAGWGIPAIYTDTRPGTKTNATTTIATYTVGAADGTFEIAANINVTVSTTVTMTVTCAYTDEANVARTLTLPFFLLAGTLVQSITTAQGNIAYASMPIYIRCKAATTITLATAGTVTAVTYTSEGTIKQVA